MGNTESSPSTPLERQTTAVLVSPARSHGERPAPQLRRLSTFRGDGGGAGGQSAIGILVHGCHLEADGWEHIVWGEPPHQLGRLPHAALLAWEERHSLKCVTIGTGASHTAAGEAEGEYMLRVLLERMHTLPEFHAFRGIPIARLEDLLRNVASAETKSQNTTEEVSEGLMRLAQAGCKRAVLVSSPTHLPRCLACACVVEEREPGLFCGSVWASPCDTSYASASASDVVVVEPPHRGDRDKGLDDLPFHDMVKRSYKVPASKKRDFLKRFDALLKEYNA